jgi:hypothetical protein
MTIAGRSPLVSLLPHTPAIVVDVVTAYSVSELTNDAGIVGWTSS